MASEIIMPKLGFDMEAGTLLKWLKSEGESVSQGEAVVEIETDKANIEVEAEASGTLQKILVDHGETVPVGTVLGVIAAPGEEVEGAPPKEKPERPKKERPAEDKKPPEKAEAPAREDRRPAPAEEERLKASPLARHLAREEGIDLRAVEGTGPGGRVKMADVRAYVERAKAAPPVRVREPEVAFEERELSRMRQTIARRMQESKQTVPHFYITTEIDMTEAMQVRQRLNDFLGDDAKVSVNDLIVKATALALTKFRNLNASFAAHKIQIHQEINVGVAVALDEGLITPVIHDCDEKSLVQISRDARGIVERARAGKLRPDDLSGGTFTTSNLGMFDVDHFIAIVNPPEAAILATGSVMQVPVVVDGQVVVRDRMKVTISADHRVTDGAEAARFLQEVKRLLENPLSLLLV